MHNTSVLSSLGGPSAPQIACAEKGNLLSEDSITNLVVGLGLALPRWDGMLDCGAEAVKGT